MQNPWKITTETCQIDDFYAKNFKREGRLLDWAQVGANTSSEAMAKTMAAIGMEV